MTSTTNVETNQTSEEQPRYIESASATTNPDNANSGAKAYVIAAIAIVVLIGISIGIGSCAALVGRAAYASRGSLGSGLTSRPKSIDLDDYDLDDYDFDLDDLDLDDLDLDLDDYDYDQGFGGTDPDRLYGDDSTTDTNGRGGRTSSTTDVFSY